tara:strand:+ start:9654 stop:9767 length:114 start_codon:yes stop_codon:yes gene_type:complete
MFGDGKRDSGVALLCETLDNSGLIAVLEEHQADLCDP